MPREIIRPSFGEPCIVQLSHAPADAIQREGQYGIDFEFHVNSDSGIMWLPPDAKRALEASGATEGDEIAITKIKRGRQTLWAVERVADETPRKPAAPPQAKQPAPPAATPAPRAAEPARPAAQMLAAALYSAIDATIAANEYAAHKGLPIRLGGDDIRSLAITLYIDARKEAK